MIDSQPDLAPLIRRVRGGYLKIQGTWMPYEVRFNRVANAYRLMDLLGCIEVVEKVFNSVSSA